MIVAFTDTALEEYNYWAENDKKIHKRTKLPIKDADKMILTYSCRSHYKK